MTEIIASAALAVNENLNIQKQRIQNGGSQTRLSLVTGTHGDELEGQYLAFRLGAFLHKNIEKLNAEAGETVTFDRVLCVVDGENTTVGTPVIEGAAVTAKVEKSGKAAKVRVYKMKPKKGYRLTQGHRQPYTKLTVEAIRA